MFWRRVLSPEGPPISDVYITFEASFSQINHVELHLEQVIVMVIRVCKYIYIFLHRFSGFVLSIF